VTRQRQLNDPLRAMVIAVALLAGLVGPAAEHVASASEPGFDAGNNRVLIPDTSNGAVVAVSLHTGDSAILSGEGHGAGRSLAGPTSLVVDADDGRALVTDYKRNALFSVDLATGDRSLLSSHDHGSGPKLRLAARNLST